MSESEFREPDQRRCSACGGPLGRTFIDQAPNGRQTSGISPLVQAIDDFIEKWERAERLEAAYIERVKELKRAGAENARSYVSDRTHIHLSDADMTSLRKRLDAKVAAAEDPADRAAEELNATSSFPMRSESLAGNTRPQLPSALPISRRPATSRGKQPTAWILRA